MTKREYSKFYVFLIYLFLAVSTFIAYEPMRHNDFIDFDDPEYVTNNPHVKGGITRESIIWAFTTTHMGNWHPLTWLNHMLDWKLFGPNPFWHHLESLLFHIANTLLLFAVFKRMTGALWCSAFVAAAFALHPLHVESVVWISERKDVLSSFFWMLTMWNYVRYTEHPGINRYLLTLLTFVLGLMAKPMLVTLPFVLLLLDYWPLGRLQLGQSTNSNTPTLHEIKLRDTCKTVARLVAEKTPLFVLTAASCVITYFAQQSVGSVVQIRPVVRIANAVLACSKYIWLTFWPVKLAVFYPYPGVVPMTIRAGSAVFLLLISIIVILMLRRRPYLAVGWLWYLGTLVPVVGLVQVGSQAMADRYTYVPIIGLFIIVAWQVPQLIVRWPYKKSILTATITIVVLAMMMCTLRQTRYWQNNSTLASHALKVTEGNYLAYKILGSEFYKQGNFEDAIYHYKESLKLRPDYANVEGDIGLALLKLGRLNEAAAQFRKALMLKGDMHKWHSSLAIALDKLGQLDEAITHYRQALKLKSDEPLLHKYLVTALCRKGNFEDAIRHYENWLRLNPNQPDIIKNMGDIYLMAGKNKQAIDCWTKAIELKPDFNEALNNLAWILATTKDAKLQNPIKAVECAQRACELTKHNQPTFLDTLAVAYAAAGNFPEAIKTAERAIELAAAAGEEDLAMEIRKRLDLYKSGQPYRGE